MSEAAIQTSCALDANFARMRINALRRDKFLKLRQPGDEGESGVMMNHVYINFEEIRNIVAYKLRVLRASMEKMDINTSRSRRWKRKEMLFQCMECSKPFHLLYAKEIFNPRYKMFMCTICMGSVEALSIDMPKIINVAKHNVAYAKLYMLLKAVDEYQPPNEAVCCDNITKNKLSMKVRVRFVPEFEEEEEESYTQKETPPWFL